MRPFFDLQHLEEISSEQLVQDVKLAAEGSRHVEFYGTAGGIVPSPRQVAQRVRTLLGGEPVYEGELPMCPEAQADGVPCTEVGRDCVICERAVPL